MPLGMEEQKFLAGFHDPKDWTFLAWGAFPTSAQAKAAIVSKDSQKFKKSKIQSQKMPFKAW